MNNRKLLRALTAALLALASGGTGYLARGESGPQTTITAPAPGTIRVVYSLDEKKTDEEIIALIDAAKERISFAIYTFTLPSIADALVNAKNRGVEVRGIVDSEQAASSYGAPIMRILTDAGILVETEKHASGNGIMHIKAIVTESAYALGSYNWTNSATTINDEILEIGTDPTLRQTYEDLLARLLDEYKGTSVGAPAPTASAGTIDYTDTPKHIGETATVRGTLVSAHTTSTGTVFLDFCKNYKTCPFTAVIFADDAKRFGDLTRFEGFSITLTGKISSYQGKAEIILSSPTQLLK